MQLSSFLRLRSSLRASRASFSSLYVKYIDFDKGYDNSHKVAYDQPCNSAFAFFHVPQISLQIIDGSFQTFELGLKDHYLLVIFEDHLPQPVIVQGTLDKTLLVKNISILPNGREEE